MFLHWPDADVHLTVDDLRLATDPALRARAEARRLTHDQAFGAAVRALRESSGIAQSRVAGLSARHLRRIENGYVPGDEAIAAAGRRARHEPRRVPGGRLRANARALAALLWGQPRP